MIIGQYITSIEPEMCSLCERSEMDTDVEVIPYLVQPNFNAGSAGIVMCTDCCLHLHGFPAYTNYDPSSGGIPLNMPYAGWTSDGRTAITRSFWLTEMGDTA